MSILDAAHRPHLIARLRPAAGWGELRRVLAWGAVGGAMLWWWSAWGVRIASGLVDAAIRSPHARQELLAYAGAFYITWTVIGHRLVRRPRSHSSVPPAGVTVPTGPDVAHDRLWSLQRRARHEAAHAVVCAWVGERVLLVDIESVDGRGGRMVPGHAEKSLADHAWGRLITLVAGQVADLQAGMHDYGASTDMAGALQAAAAIISTAQRPTAYHGELTTDGRLTAARREATRALAEHVDVLDAVVAALLADPARPLRGRQLDELLEPITTTSRKAAHS